MAVQASLGSKLYFTFPWHAPGMVLLNHCTWHFRLHFIILVNFAILHFSDFTFICSGKLGSHIDVAIADCFRDIWLRRRRRCRRRSSARLVPGPLHRASERRDARDAALSIDC
eukprot:3013948-Pleurochrysis_carterae.AAC.3